MNHFQDKDTNALVNQVLEKESAGYRFVGGEITAISDKQEIESIETALADNAFPGVQGHLRRALELFSDRKNHDYRNSIKESISAVESLAKSITSNENASLGDALAEIERSGEIHGALKKGFSSLYGYTRYADGIRPSMIDDPNLTAGDAIYFLVSCSAFINYLKSKI